MSRLNLRVYKRDYTDAIVELLRLLSKSPVLSTELPRWRNSCPVHALIEAEAQGLCSAERLSYSREQYTRSVWEWQITPRGKTWLAEWRKAR
jgi:hypothetical protein